MERALELAARGCGFVNPNPMVGAVITKNNQIIGEGYHEYYGGPHAEVNAFKNATDDVTGATIYVTMEPCNHHGKTPPCTEKIIENKISRVVIGTTDPNELVDGKGIARLKQAGISVALINNQLGQQAQQLNEIYNHFIKTKKPFIALKTAMTLDGKIATKDGHSKWVTGEMSRAKVHELRHQYTAIMVGVETVIADDPELSDRSKFENKKNPLRIIVDSNGRTPGSAKIFNTSSTKTIIATTEYASKQFVEEAKHKGAEVIVCPAKSNRVDLGFLLQELGKRQIDSILVEGGGTLNFSMIEDGLAHKIFVFVAPKILGGKDAISAFGGKGFERMDLAMEVDIHSIRHFDNDILVEAYLRL